MTAEPGQWADDAQARATLETVKAAIRSAVVPERSLLADRAKLAEANDVVLRLLEANKARLAATISTARRSMTELKPLLAGAVFFALQQAQLVRLHRELAAAENRIAARKRTLDAGLKRDDPALVLKDQVSRAFATPQPARNRRAKNASSAHRSRPMAPSTQAHRNLQTG